MILGDTCTRTCRFCNVSTGVPSPPEPDEPDRVAEAAARLDLAHVVITSVTRDDLEDFGAGQFARTIEAIRGLERPIRIEVLIPDLGGDRDMLKLIIAAGPHLLGHNLETVPSLYRLRPGADYRRSLDLLDTASKLSPDTRTKSAIMLGLGETVSEVIRVFHDLRGAGCSYLSIGQYLQPSRKNIPVQEYISPERFEELGDAARELGFLHVESGPYVRSSYMAERYE
jgi:lipoic acid synthetase